MSRPQRRAETEALHGQPPFFETFWEGLLFAGASVAVVGVALYFNLSVNRVFDVPKAVALKTLGGITAFAWLCLALYGPGMRWRAAQVFAAPVVALLVAMLISTLLSIDVSTSLYGVYERQFGLQGFVGCVGLYFVVATTVQSRRGAIAGLSLVALLGGMLGAYAFLQSQGHDPWPFFREPHNKVYAFLGNATFAGNALALIFPVSSMVGLVGLFETKREAKNPGDWLSGILVGFFGVVLLLVLPGFLTAADLETGDRGQSAQRALRVGFTLGAALLFGSLGMGSRGPKGIQLKTERAQRIADAIAAGALVACGFLIAAGIFYTRTRGAWVGTTIAVFAGFVLLPRLFRDEPKLYRRVFILCWSALVTLAVSLTAFVVWSDSLPARTIRSIPAAFETNRGLGKGQGTRPYLWGESIRVLTEHEDTLARIEEDRRERAAQVRGPLVEDMPFLEAKPVSSLAAGSVETALRRVSVWLFGIGIETYRYAFMSHKSKRLEALDPMTNHDNPHNNYLYILASLGVLGLVAYLWLLGRLLLRSFAQFVDVGRPRAHRALAFGVVTSFFSYAVYSIAGFDSVACSVFFYFVLGLTAVLFEPTERDLRESLTTRILHWGRRWWRGRADTNPVVRSVVSGVLVVSLGSLLLHTAWSGWSIYRAERAFTGRDNPGPNTVDKRVSDIHKAIRINPNESYYKQMLGSTHAQAATQFLQRATQFQRLALKTRTQDPARAQQLLVQSQAFRRSATDHTEKARIALYAALKNAWAPENIYISLFQALYAVRDDQGSQQALERALRHSPHLGAVRANLAALKLARGDWDGALVDCRWVLEVDRKSTMALRTCGKALLEKGATEEARAMLERARTLAPKDTNTLRYLAELDAKTSTAKPLASPQTSTFSEVAAP